MVLIAVPEEEAPRASMAPLTRPPAGGLRLSGLSPNPRSPAAMQHPRVHSGQFGSPASRASSTPGLPRFSVLPLRYVPPGGRHSKASVASDVAATPQPPLPSLPPSGLAPPPRIKQPSKYLRAVEEAIGQECHMAGRPVSHLRPWSSELLVPPSLDLLIGNAPDILFKPMATRRRSTYVASAGAMTPRRNHVAVMCLSHTYRIIVTRVRYYWQYARHSPAAEWVRRRRLAATACSRQHLAQRVRVTALASRFLISQVCLHTWQVASRAR